MKGKTETFSLAVLTMFLLAGSTDLIATSAAGIDEQTVAAINIEIEFSPLDLSEPLSGAPEMLYANDIDYTVDLEYSNEEDVLNADDLDGLFSGPMNMEQEQTDLSFEHANNGESDHFEFTLRLVPEPLTLTLLAAGGFWILRRKQ